MELKSGQRQLKMDKSGGVNIYVVDDTEKRG